MLGLQGDDDLEEFGLHADLGKRTSKLHFNVEIEVMRDAAI